MRWLIAGLLLAWSVLTAVAYVFVLPDTRQDESLILAYFEVGPDGDGPAHEVVRAYLAATPTLNGEPHPSLSDLLTRPDTDPQRQSAVASFRAWWTANRPTPLDQTPTLVWSTDDNPARRTQCQLFRVWHLRTFGEPLDIRTDPTNRDPTKTIVQCVADAGPDIIETYGPAQLEQFVSAGVAMDITDKARERGFGLDRVFPAAVSSMSKDGRQYAFVCNVGYTVLFYHRDVLREAGIAEPPQGRAWTLAETLEITKKLTATSVEGGRRRVGIMGLGAWGMALADGATFFNEDGTASFFNGPAAVSAFKAFQDLMYVHKVMPTPAELASMASAGGANMNMGAEAASASALFAAKVAVMISDGRWSYVALAQRQRDRVIVPAMERRLRELKSDESERAAREAELLRTAMVSLQRDVLVPISDEQYAAMEASLTPADRANLLQIGIAHVPSTSGVPFYEAAARVAIVNRASPQKDLAVRFIEFLASEPYNDQINFTFDSISGTPGIIAKNGISGPPRALPGLEAFDSPVFVEAMEKFAHPWELSPFIGRNRLGQLVGPIMERLTNNTIGPSEAARLIEERINDQIHANLVRDAELRAAWERAVGKAFDRSRGVKEQVEESSPQRHGDAEKRTSCVWPARREHQGHDLAPPEPRHALSSQCLCASVVNCFDSAVNCLDRRAAA